jgi:hypothetical protein
MVTEPASRTNLTGTVATFTATATGSAPLTYQWLLNGVGLMDGGKIGGATSPTVILTNVQPSDAGFYELAVSNGAGAATSSVATLDVLVPPSINIQPTNLYLVTGSDASFSVTASGTSPLVYDWQRDGLSIADGTNLSGSATPTLTLLSLSTNDSGSYWVVITNIAGSTTSFVAQLTVSAMPVAPSFTMQPSNQVGVIGHEFTLSGLATGTMPLSYTWLKDGTNLPADNRIAGENSPVLLVTGVAPTDAGRYQLVVTNSGGAATSPWAVVTTVAPAVRCSDALVLVNSKSPRFPDFQHFIQPYLDNFGIPYLVQDIATNSLSTNVGSYAEVVIGHRQLDTNHLYLSTNDQMSLSAAISNGTGLVNFDSDLWTTNGAPQYKFIQDVFQFSNHPPVSASTVSFPTTDPFSQMHFITALHATNENLSLSNAMSVSGAILGSNDTAIAIAGGQPFVTITRFGNGRGVQWASYDWVSTTVQGPVNGLDDLVWRGLVWAGRKPFVLRGLPNFLAMRVDDVDGPLWWVHVANEVGFKPYLALFISDISQTNIPDLRTLITNGNATAGIHSFTSSSLFYFDHQNETNYSDTVLSNNFYAGKQWLLTNGIPASKCVIPHYSEIGPNAFAGLMGMGVEFIAIEVVPGTVEYGTPPAPWLKAGPYRLYDPPGPGESNLPLYYADFLGIPGHSELNGKFFDRYTEIRNSADVGQFECGEWCPSNSDVPGSISRGTRELKRALDGMVLASVFTHEWYIHPTACCGSTAITTNNWRAILQGITNNLGVYKPIYVTTDYADQYVRATKTSRLNSAQLDLSSGELRVMLTGQTDLDTSVQVFVGEDSSISRSYGSVPTFVGAVTSVVSTIQVPPVVLGQPSSQAVDADATITFSVTAGGSTPLSYRWMKNGTPLNNGGNVSGATTANLTLSSVLGADAASYSVIVINASGTITSAPATLSVVDPVIVSQPLSRTNHPGTLARFDVGVNGTSPNYQWSKNGVPATGATDPSFVLPFVTDQDAGSYTVTVSNLFGSTTSGPALLTVAAPLEIQHIGLTDGVAQITWSAIPGNIYTLQFKSSLDDSNWTDLLPPVIASSPSATSTNILGDSTQRFYRVYLPP